MSGLAAANVGIRDRGRIAPGYFADIVLFDAKIVADRADFGNAQAQAAGIPGAERPSAYADLDPALVVLALAWAVRDLVSWQSGELPGTWSSTVGGSPHH